MDRWSPHVTVACVIEKDGKYLMVEERDKFSGEMVFNQPAGHLEDCESLTEAALRETLEETGWRVQLTGVLGIALHRAPSNNNTYFRTTFLATPLLRDEDAVIDPDIHAVHWLDYEEILAKSARMRSPIALAVIEQHRQGIFHPLDLILGT
ncbi:Phosphatase NudJ [Halioglobus japonicus]|nr:Phosphatase NudJ [Halioglobus japonicus]